MLMQDRPLKQVKTPNKTTKITTKIISVEANSITLTLPVVSVLDFEKQYGMSAHIKAIKAFQPLVTDLYKMKNGCFCQWGLLDNSEAQNFSSVKNLKFLLLG